MRPDDLLLFNGPDGPCIYCQNCKRTTTLIGYSIAALSEAFASHRCEGQSSSGSMGS